MRRRPTCRDRRSRRGRPSSSSGNLRGDVRRWASRAWARRAGGGGGWGSRTRGGRACRGGLDGAEVRQPSVEPRLVGEQDEQRVVAGERPLLLVKGALID